MDAENLEKVIDGLNAGRIVYGDGRIRVEKIFFIIVSILVLQSLVGIGIRISFYQRNHVVFF